jgi:hypothetical protein
VRGFPIVAGGSESRPLPSYDPSALPSTASDPVASAKAYRWSDGSPPKRPFPYTVSQGLAGWSVNVLRPRAIDALARAGFPVIFDQAPVFPARLKTGHRPPKLEGFLVGERGIHYDAVRRRYALYRIALFGALGLGGIFATVLEVNSPFIPLIAIATGGGLAGVLISATGYGAFDSDVVYVAYATTLDPSNPVPTVETPLTFDVRIGAARVATVNWASKTGSGRSFKAVVPGGEGLRDVPVDVLARILG